MAGGGVCATEPRLCGACECAGEQEEHERTNLALEDARGWRNWWRKQIALLYQRVEWYRSFIFCFLFLPAVVIDGCDGGNGGGGIPFRPRRDIMYIYSSVLRKMENLQVRNQKHSFHFHINVAYRNCVPM